MSIAKAHRLHHLHPCAGKRTIGKIGRRATGELRHCDTTRGPVGAHTAPWAAFFLGPEMTNASEFPLRRRQLTATTVNFDRKAVLLCHILSPNTRPPRTAPRLTRQTARTTSTA